MFCPNCGNQIESGQKFCASCGEKLDIEEYLDEEKTTENANSTPVVEEKHSTGSAQGKQGKSCVCCGGKVNLLTRTKLMDGNYLCSNCTSIVPGYMKKSIKDWFVDDYYEYKDYRKYSQESLAPMYNEMASYGKISLDLEHGLFYLNGGFLGGLKPDTLILEMKNVMYYEFDFIPKEYKEGMFSDTVYGKTVFLIAMEKPSFVYMMVLDKEIKTKGRVSGIFSKKLVYEMPKKLEKFEANFERAYLRAHPDENTYGVEYDEALRIFGINDISGASVDDLKAIRSDLVRQIENQIESGSADDELRRINGAFNCLKMEI